jgi:hypothetical protein
MADGVRMTARTRGGRVSCLVVVMIARRFCGAPDLAGIVEFHICDRRMTRKQGATRRRA